MYYLQVMSPGTIRLPDGSTKRLMAGDIYEVENSEASVIALNSYPFLQFGAADPEEVEKPESLAKNLKDRAEKEKAAIPVLTNVLEQGPVETANEDVIVELDANAGVEIDLAADAKAPAAVVYLRSLGNLADLPVAKIKAVAARYPNASSVQNVVAELLGA